MSDAPTDRHAGTTRRGFLKAASRAAMALLGVSSFLPSVRRAFAAAPVWTTIPPQVWTIGLPVSLDLKAYCTDADGDPLTFTLDRALPPGLTLNGSIISGTPTAVFSAAQFVASADDGTDTVPPAPTSDLEGK
jgi:Putative Ig domain